MFDALIERELKKMASRNPILQLPVAAKIAKFPQPARELLSEVLKDLSKHSNQTAEKRWNERKGFIAAYWRVMAIYSRHIALALTAPERAVRNSRKGRA